MASLVQRNQLFSLKINSTLLGQLAIHNVSPTELAEFAYSQITNMLSCKPNCLIYKKSNEDIWILRGYYPNTPVFFKLTLVKNLSGENFTYWARLRPLVVNVKRSWSNKNRVNYGEFVLGSNDINTSIVKTMENSLLGSSHKIEPLIKINSLKPRCMSPKGMKLFNYEKPKKTKT